MPETQKTPRMPEFLREPLELAQARLESLETEAQKVIKDLMKKGRESRKDMAELMQRLSKQDWNIEELRGRVAKVRAQGAEAAQELRGKAGSFRSEALERLEELQSKTIQFLGVASRDQVEELSREFEKLTRRLDREKPGKKPARKNGKRASAQG